MMYSYHTQLSLTLRRSLKFNIYTHDCKFLIRLQDRIGQSTQALHDVEYINKKLYRSLVSRQKTRLSQTSSSLMMTAAALTQVQDRVRDIFKKSSGVHQNVSRLFLADINFCRDVTTRYDEMHNSRCCVATAVPWFYEITFLMVY